MGTLYVLNWEIENTVLCLLGVYTSQPLQFVPLETASEMHGILEPI